MRLPHVLFIALLAYGAWQYLGQRPILHPAGAVAKADPVQSEVADAKPIAFKDFRITPLASFSAHARVLAVAEYSNGRESELSPVDLALGWGRMSDSAFIDQLDIRQSRRFYFYSWPASPPMPPQEIVEHSANMHFIPANREIEQQLRKVRVGHLVEFSGFLVRADATDGWHWVSSLTRSDSGAGACELVWIEQLNVH